LLANQNLLLETIRRYARFEIYSRELFVIAQQSKFAPPRSSSLFANQNSLPGARRHCSPIKIRSTELFAIAQQSKFASGRFSQ
jgi:hypothetical protein